MTGSINLPHGSAWDSDIITVGELKKIIENIPDDVGVVIGTDNKVDYITHILVGKYLVGLFCDDEDK